MRGKVKTSEEGDCSFLKVQRSELHNEMSGWLFFLLSILEGIVSFFKSTGKYECSFSPDLITFM